MNFWQSDLFLPHGFCFAWNPWVLTLTELGNGMISIAYVLIPAQLVYMLYGIKYRRIYLTRNPTMKVTFALFIFMCGVSHAIDIATIYSPLYAVQAIWLCATGMVSLMTAGLLQYTLLPERHHLLDAQRDR